MEIHSGQDTVPALGDGLSWKLIQQTEPLLRNSNGWHSREPEATCWLDSAQVSQAAMLQRGTGAALAQGRIRLTTARGQ